MPGNLEGEVRAIASLLKRALKPDASLSRLAGLLADNIKKEQEFMSQITDWAAQEQADLTTISNTLDSIVQGIAALDAMISQFQNSPGSLNAADQAALDGIQAASQALVTKSGSISVAPPPPPAP